MSDYDERYTGCWLHYYTVVKCFLMFLNVLNCIVFFHIMNAIAQFLPRDAMLSALYVSVCLSVCLSVCVCVSVTLRYCIKTAKHRIMQITPYDSPGI